MRKPKHFPAAARLLLALLLALTACTALPLAGGEPPSPSTATPEAAPGLTPTAVPAPTSADLRLVVFYTSDEHGWMLGEFPGKGAAELSGLWDAQPYVAGAEVLILSGGDNWTGPAISTWYDGESMVEVMNAMGYDAAALGNHEFDFGQPVLQQRVQQAAFPYLSANLRRSEGGFPSELGVQPYALLEVGPLRVGVIGLTTTSTPTQADPKKLQGLTFLDYDTALRETVPQVQQAGADLIFVLAHVCPDEVTRLAVLVRKLNLPLITAGHCHQSAAFKVGSTVILSPGSNLEDYAYAVFTLDPASKAIRQVTYGVKPNRGGQPDPQVAAVIARWKQVADAELNVPIGYLQKPLTRISLSQQALVVESWLWAYPAADVALTNLGGLRADLPAGAFTLADVIGMLPFDNTLVALHLNGQQLLTLLDRASGLAIGGARRVGGAWQLKRTSQPVDPAGQYVVLVNDFIYAGGDGWTLLAELDPQAEYTGIDWRQPVIDWIRQQHSSPEHPLEQALQTFLP